MPDIFDAVAPEQDVFDQVAPATPTPKSAIQKQAETKAAASVARPIPSELDTSKIPQSVWLPPRERTGSSYVAAPNQESPTERLGDMVPQAAVPALSAIQKYAVDPFNKLASKGAEAGRAFGEATLGYGTPKQIESLPGGSTALGVVRGVGSVAGSTAADPRSWPFFLSGAGTARPVLQKMISAGFAGQMSVEAVESAKTLHRDWDKLTPAQRAEMATQTGLTAAMAAGATKHGFDPRLGIGITPDQVSIRAGINPPVGGPVMGEVRIPRGPKPTPLAPAGTTIEPPTIEGNAQPMSRQEATDILDHPANRGTPTPQNATGWAQSETEIEAIRRGSAPTPAPIPDENKVPKAQRASTLIKQDEQAKLAKALEGRGAAKEALEKQDVFDKVTANEKPASVSQTDQPANSVPAAEGKGTPAASAPPATVGGGGTVPEAVRPASDVPSQRETAPSPSFNTPEFRAHKAAEDAYVEQAKKLLPENPSNKDLIAKVMELKKAGGGSPASGPSRAIEGQVLPPEGKQSGYEHRGGKFYKDGKVLDKSDDIADAVAALEPQKMIDGQVAKPEEKDVFDTVAQFKHRSTQANIAPESEAGKAIETARQRIADTDLAGKGKEVGGSHVTVRYGLKADTDVEGVKRFLAAQEPFEATLGKTDVFPPSESSDNAAVVHAPIESPELERINKEIEKHGEFAPSNFGEYRPHATLAYLDPSKANRYKGMDVTAGKKFKVDTIHITDREGKSQPVRLEGKADRHSTPYMELDSFDKVEPSSEPTPGKVGDMKVSDLTVAPHKFQYKMATDAEGVSPLLKETRVFNPDLAGVVSVWRDPSDGRTYVVNGHHRYELAKRTGQKNITVRHIEASDAVAARAIGAQQNIAEGRGTAVDAAKYFRDTGTTPEDLQKKGISLGEATAKDGMALSRLDQGLFNRVVSGDLRQGRAKAIGEATDDHAEQKAILSLVERKERSGAKVSDDTLAELIRLVKGSEQTTETTADLFGTQQITRSLALEKAEISAHIKQQLSRDKKLFGFVAKEGRATELARAGNRIDVDRSKEVSTSAAQAEEVYNKLSERGGPISSILDESARRLADGENGGTVKADAYQRVRAEVSKTLGEPEERSPDRPKETPQANQEIEPTLPGMEQVPAERAEASAEQHGKDLSDKLTEPPKSIERAAGEMEQKSPLFRDTEANPQGGLFGSERGAATLGAINPLEVVKSAKKVYSDFIDKIIREKLDLGDKYRRVAEHDKAIASMLHEKDNAPRYFRDKADSNVTQVTKGLSEDQVRLTAMMADNQIREYLQEEHPDQYDEARNDPAVMKAVQTFKKYQDELAALRIKLGWHVRRDLSSIENEDGTWSVVDQDGDEVDSFKTFKQSQDYVEDNGKLLDHLKRTYPEHMREPLMGATNEPSASGAPYGGIRPPRPDKKQRIASAEYFFQHGAKDFSGYVKSFTQAYHAALNQKIYDSLTGNAQLWKEGTALPPQIEYRGKTYYSPDVAKSMKLAKPENRPKVIEEYRAYDPARDDKALIKSFEDGWSTQTTGRPGISPSDRYLAPKDVVDALDHYDMTRGVQEGDSIRRFFQEQIVGLFGPTVHVFNIMRRLANVAGNGVWDPRAWPMLVKLLGSSELRARMAEGLADDAIDALSKHGTYTNTRDIGSLHDYVLGNMDPRNWVRWTIGKFSKGVLFDPKFLGGFGGLDQKARVLAYDYLRDEAGMGEEEAARNVEDGFGNYNKANWTERMRRWARALLFPGWDFSSLKWFLRHPIKTAAIPALATMAANLALNKAGKNKDQDKYDFGYLHYGDRKYRSSLVTESMAMHIAQPILEAGKAALEGGSAKDVAVAAGEGVIRGGGGLAGSLRPEIQAAAELLSNRQYLGGNKEITKPEDANYPGKVLPTRKLDKQAVFALVKAFPAISRFLDSSYDNVDVATGLGSVTGVTNYKSGAEERLRANGARAKGYSQTLSILAESDPDAASKFVEDPQKAMYLMFNKDFSELEGALKDIDKQTEQVRLAHGISKSDRDEALKGLEESRKQVLNSADAIADAMQAARLQMKK